MDKRRSTMRMGPESTKLKLVEATYISEDGVTFKAEAFWPMKNIIHRYWRDHNNVEWETSFVYSGFYNNALLYHEIPQSQGRIICHH